jgi:hypothetical protein
VAHREALLGGTAVDLALDIENYVDALHCLESERRNDRELAARLDGDIGKLEELAASVRLMSSTT